MKDGRACYCPVFAESPIYLVSLQGGVIAPCSPSPKYIAFLEGRLLGTVSATLPRTLGNVYAVAVPSMPSMFGSCQIRAESQLTPKCMQQS